MNTNTIPIVINNFCPSEVKMLYIVIFGENNRTCLIVNMISESYSIREETERILRLQVFVLMAVVSGTVSIIIPTLNEQLGIQETISSILKSKITEKYAYDVEILVIDADSNDLTRDLAAKMGAKVIIDKQKGYGHACKLGFSAAKGDIIVTVDGDNTYPTEFMTEYIEKLNQNDMDFITINRFADMERGSMSFTRRFGNKILTLAVRLLYSIEITDSQSGMWIMKRDFISKIRLNSDDMSLSEEIKIVAFKFFRALELDGKYYRRAGNSNLKIIRVGWKNLRYLFMFRKKIKSAIALPCSPV
jgi:dolichol-phosphate hexosyltransferase